MLSLFRVYVGDPGYTGKWIAASENVARTAGRKRTYARSIRSWCQKFLDNGAIPRNAYGTWSASILHTEEDLKLQIVGHLQSLGKYFSAADLLAYINEAEMLERLERQRGFSLRTAQRWLKFLSFRWQAEQRGMYVDGHERADVVQYRQGVFVPTYFRLHESAASFDNNGVEIPREPFPPGQNEVIIHHHDETTFYGNDRRKLRWVHDSESPKPYAKGEGQSVMVADFVSAKLGWLASPDGRQRARVTILPGKARDGYFTCDEVLQQLSSAMDILDEHYASYRHAFILDNARTHTKRAENALSARRMPKHTRQNFQFDTVVRDGSGRPVVQQNGQPLVERRRMEDATLADGSAQPLYFPDNHPKHPGHFKGMTELLRERGFDAPERLKAQCKGFKCDPGVANCCQRRILFNEPDFARVPSIAERFCSARGYQVVFLPKFHPELNFIEMCWGYGKRLYRELPPAPRVTEVKANALSSLDSVPRTAMRR
jgi:hypothetical protein